jgi:hypothetical protein
MVNFNPQKQKIEGSQSSQPFMDGLPLFMFRINVGMLNVTKRGLIGKLNNYLEKSAVKLSLKEQTGRMNDEKLLEVCGICRVSIFARNRWY